MCVSKITQSKPKKMPQTRIGYKIVHKDETRVGGFLTALYRSEYSYNGDVWVTLNGGWSSRGTLGSDDYGTRYEMGVHAFATKRVNFHKYLNVVQVQVRLDGPICEGRDEMGRKVVVYRHCTILKEMPDPC